MEFIQKKTKDSAVEAFLSKAADMGVSLAWDRFEGQLPECGFCESGLSCRDCLQGPCISHPFKDDIHKVGVCGKDKDTLAVHTLLRLVIKGTMGYLDQVHDLAEEVASGALSAVDKERAEELCKEVKGLFTSMSPEVTAAFPASMTDRWGAAGVVPRGVAFDVIKASQKLEGGVAGLEETLLWAYKCALLGCMAQRLMGQLKAAAFGEAAASRVDVNLGVLKKDYPNIVVFGDVSPALKQKIVQAARGENVGVAGVCTDSLGGEAPIPPVTNYGSQEIPFMTGAVDLAVVGDQSVNPSVAAMAAEFKVPVVYARGLKQEDDIAAFASRIVADAKMSFAARKGVERTVPQAKQSAVMGFAPGQVSAAAIAEALEGGSVKGVVIFGGSNNVKFSQDEELVTMAKEFLKNDVLCLCEGDAGVALAKYGLLDPARDAECGSGVAALLDSLGENMPAVLDMAAGGVTGFLMDLAAVKDKAACDYPVIACFPEANRSMDVARALWTTAMGISTYVWPFLPVTGSTKTVDALSGFCSETFGAALNVIARKKVPALVKARGMIKELEGTETPSMGGKEWK